jgi:phosphoribosylformylglycinamidine synthase PurS subunit
MKAQVNVMLKDGVLDPQGKAVNHALGGLGYDTVKSVRQGKLIELELDETDSEKAEQKVRDMCEKLLANTVIESYSIEILG